MKAMILAAGLGTRLRPLTDDRPKALVEVAGRPMLEWVICRLAGHGFTDIIINAHHFAEQIEDFVARYEEPGVSLTVSVEEEILDTGGGVRKAAWFFDREEPFLVHNVDVLTDLDLSGFMQVHQTSDAVVTVAVKERKSSRHLLFDKSGRLWGWKSDVTGATLLPPRPSRDPLFPVPFMGVYAMSPAVLGWMEEETGPFSIIEVFMEIVAGDSVIQAYRADDARWADLGSRDRITSAERLFGADWFAGIG